MECILNEIKKDATNISFEIRYIFFSRAPAQCWTIKTTINWIKLWIDIKTTIEIKFPLGGLNFYFDLLALVTIQSTALNCTPQNQYYFENCVKSRE